MKAIDIQLHKVELARTVTVDAAYTAGRAVVNPTNLATMAVAVVDTVSERCFHSEADRTTWFGSIKRTTPGLGVAVGATFITGAALPEALGAWTVYKVMKKTWNSLSEFAEGRQEKIVDFNPATKFFY